MISILIITRGRKDSLKELVDSIVSNAYDIDNIELFFGYDSDDTETVNYIGELKARLNVREIVYNRTNNSPINKHEYFLNPMAKACSGKYIWGINDDVVIETKHFDLHLENEIESFLKNRKSRILLAKANERLSSLAVDHSQVGHVVNSYYQFDYAFYPIMTRETVDLLGFFVPPELPNTGADIYLGMIFNKSIANRFLKLYSVGTLDKRISKVTDSNHISYNNYSKDAIDRDVKKLDDHVMQNLNDESINIERVKIYFCMKCKSCGGQIKTGDGLTSKIVTCPDCNTRNVVSDTSLRLSDKVPMIERQILR